MMMMKARPQVLALAALALAGAQGCWQPPELPPPEPPVPPTEAELLGARPYTLFVPAGYSAASTWPLLISLHGYGGDGASSASYLGLPALVRARKSFHVAPNGAFDSRGNRAWHPSIVHAPSWDVEYLLAVIHDVKAKYRIDPGRVFVIGHSQGAHMAHRLGCEAASEVAALVAIAGQLQGCLPSQAVSVLQVHGTDDEAIGYNGDVQGTSSSIPTAHETIDLWARRDGCAQPIASTGATKDLVSDVDGAETSVEAYSGCPAGVAVELWTMNGVGHVPFLQRTFPDELYGFLTAHARP